MSKKKQKSEKQEAETVSEEAVTSSTNETNESIDSDTESTEPVEPTPEEEIAVLKEKVEENYNLYLRARADLENYRKRMVKEKEDINKFANERLILEVLPALDNLFLAIEHAKPEQMESLVQGVTMTLEQILKALEKFGVRSIDALGQAFNSALHEALGKIESEEAPDTIVQEFQKGYLLHERLLRPARVMVAKPIEKTVESDEASASGNDDNVDTDSSVDSADEN